MLCKICNVDVIGISKISNIKLFYNHLKNKHQMSYSDYCIKFDYNDVVPTCACGCGNIVNFNKGVFLKYYKDHKNKIGNSYESIQKGILKRNEKETILYKLNSFGTTKEELIKYYDMLVTFKISFIGISKILGVDKRTIKKYWRLIGLIENQNDFDRILRKHQGIWSENINIPNLDEYNKLNELLPDIYNYISTDKHTLGEIIKVFDLNIRPNYLYKFLLDNYEYTDIIKKISHHNVSSAELEFYNVLKYYYGKKVIQQFKLVDRYYDFKLGDKILIEYDGDYWHSSEKAIQNDEYKNKLAIKNGYTIIRVMDSKSKDITILNKIDKLYKKYEKI